MEILLWPNTWQVVYKEGCNFLDGEIQLSVVTKFSVQIAKRNTEAKCVVGNFDESCWVSLTHMYYRKTIPAICQCFKATYNFGERIHLFVFSYISDKKPYPQKAFFSRNSSNSG